MTGYRPTIGVHVQPTSCCAELVSAPGPLATVVRTLRTSSLPTTRISCRQWTAVTFAVTLRASSKPSDAVRVDRLIEFE